ncbi:cytochrome c maturation protein CcmE [Iamia majanohamensis]|uniref:Cytochrome c maturation protein CcmE n=1 Tax=Iamia majanohamensis TaxID=467976 RepID=A0AAE9YAZ7_9ACTN|nr:cytochrome c maturation protein CcmE [Iamia majanohamensis]WCO67694.1 cytochrome c maturation protein CcmE [Iamia majanohamensis]
MDVNGPDLDLSPRTGPSDGGTAGRPRRSRARAWVGGLVIVGLLGAIGVVLVRQLDGASLYYYNVDEAVAQRSDIGDRRIRIQGTVVGQPDEVDDETLDFTVAFEGESVDVRYSGVEPPPLFGAGTPSVLEGRFAEDGRFRSDRIVIKHTEDYKESNSDRVAPEDP